MPEEDAPGEKMGFDAVSFPALLRAARAASGSAIKEALDKAGCDDVPSNGAFVISGTARTGASLGDIIKSLAISKQAAGQLVDSLVARGYLERNVDPEDRRRLTITLTHWGHAAATVIRSAVEAIDADLVDRVGSGYVAHTRAALAALIPISEVTDTGR